MSDAAQVAEGVATAPAGLKLAQRHSVDAPIMAAIAAVLSGEKSARYGSAYVRLAGPVLIPQGGAGRADDVTGLALTRYLPSCAPWCLCKCVCVCICVCLSVYSIYQIPHDDRSNAISIECITIEYKETPKK